MTTGENANVRLGVPAYRDAQHVMTVWENAVLTCSRDAPNPRYLQAWANTMELVAGQFPEGLLVMTMINSQARAPDDASKNHIRNTVLRYSTQIAAFAYVVEGEGFGPAAIRSALSLVSLAARYPFPMKVFGRVDDAVPWMLSRASQRLPRAQSSAQLVSVANSLSDQLRSVAAAG
jgi:hypothetical protein